MLNLSSEVKAMNGKGEFPAIDWRDDLAQVDYRGFRLLIERRLDECPDLSYLGEYSDTPGVNAVKRFEGHSSRELQYFNPGNGDYGLPPGKRGGVNAEARKYAYQDYRRMEAYNAGDWCSVGIIIHVHRAGVCLASASLWGIESDSGEDYFAEVVRELAGEAITEARLKLRALRHPRAVAV